MTYSSTEPRSLTLATEDAAAPKMAGFTASGPGVGISFSGSPLGTPATLDFPIGPPPQGAIPAVVTRLADGGYGLELAAASSDGITLQTQELTTKWPGWVMPDEYVAPLIATFTDTLTAPVTPPECASADTSWVAIPAGTRLLQNCVTTTGDHAQIQMSSKANAFVLLSFPGHRGRWKFRIDAADKTMSRAIGSYPGIPLPPGGTASADLARQKAATDDSVSAQITTGMERISESYALLTALGLSQEQAEWGAIVAYKSGCSRSPATGTVSSDPLRSFVDTNALASVVTCTITEISSLDSEQQALTAVRKALSGRRVNSATKSYVARLLLAAHAQVQVAVAVLAAVPQDTIVRLVAQQLLTSFPNVGEDDPVSFRINLPDRNGHYLYDLSGTAGAAFMSPKGKIACLMAGTGTSLDVGPHRTRCDPLGPHTYTVPPWNPPANYSSTCEFDYGHAFSLTRTAWFVCGGGSLSAIVRPKPGGRPWTHWWDAGKTWYDPAHNPHPKSRLLILGVGNSIRVDNQVCTSIPGGVRCVNTRTHHGFELTLSSYKFF